MQIQCPNCDNVSELDAEPEIGQHLICPFCGETFSYSDDDQERENGRLLEISNSVQKKSSARRDAVMDAWMIQWLMGMVLLLIWFVDELIEGIKLSSEAKGLSDDLGKFWLFFVVRWFCRVLFAVSIFMIGSRLNKSRQP